MDPSNGETLPDAPATIKLVIDFDPQTQEVRVQGPIKNRMLSLAMLKLAEKAMDEDYARDQAAKRIVRPGHNIDSLTPRLRGRG
jgi:hypothetical protein